MRKPGLKVSYWRRHYSREEHRRGPVRFNARALLWLLSMAPVLATGAPAELERVAQGASPQGYDSPDYQTRSVGIGASSVHSSLAAS